ncbi:MAG: DUF1080 domain-containing protein [Kiritimatiellae bacterium]|nr:DUF1080 domain-containing protein [Kiritimatiellia bacterium]
MKNLLFTMILAAAAPCFAADINLTLDTDKVGNRIDPKIYGHFLEHIYHSCNGGLWGDLIWDRSFEGSGAGVAWSADQGVITQAGESPDLRLTFGSPQWQDYEFTVEAQKISGDEGFLILLRSVNQHLFYWANLGGWGNVGHALERGTGGERWGPVTPRRAGRIEEGRWYRIRARCEGARIQLWLDDEQLIDYTDNGQGPARGQAGVGTWSTQARFRNFKVTALDGRTLHEGPPTLPKAHESEVPAWRVVGGAAAVTVREQPLNGEKCKQVATKDQAGGLAQQPIKITAGEVYKGSLWLRGESAGDLQLVLKDGAKLLATQSLPKPAGEWREIPIELKPSGSTTSASLEITLPPNSKIWLDQVSLMPESWRQAGGFRPDLLAAIADLKPPVIRYPGGCYASGYRWKDGIGAQHQRKAHPLMMWDDKDVNSFGTDEFIEMCRQVGAEPLIVVNIGTRQWNRNDQEHDFLREALDWMEYCNGPADSKWGKVRAANGHPEPYNVKYWEIDNETWGMQAAPYAAAVNRFGPAMRQAYPFIKLAACGSNGYDQNWNREVINLSGKNFDYISTHHYEDPKNFATGWKREEVFYRELKTVINAGPNPDIKIYCSEWNVQSTDWRTGLYCGGLLNVFERCGDFFEIGGPALFLRHTYAKAWDNAFINFDHCSWFPAPNYVIMKLWRDHYAPNFLVLEGDLKDASVVATRSDDSKTLILKAVNPSAKARIILVELQGDFQPKAAAMQMVATGDLKARNTLEKPDMLRPEKSEISLQGRVVSFTMPAYSAGVAVVSAN